jgi:hypothetical protein
MLVGAAIGYKIHNYWLAFILAFLSHFILDAIPHREYEIDSLIEKKVSRKSIFDLFQVFLDCAIGLAIILIFIEKSPYITYALLGAFAAMIPDGLTFLHWQTNAPWLKKITDFHRFTIHREEKTPLFWGIASQLVIFVIALIGLIF